MTPVEWKSRDYRILALVFGLLFVFLTTATIVCPSWPLVVLGRLLSHLSHLWEERPF